MPLRPALPAAALLLAALAAGAEPVVWVDERGVTHLGDASQRGPGEGGIAAHDLDRLRELWSGRITGPPVAPGTSSSDADRVTRLLRGAAHDLERGETARAAATLRSVLRLEPGRPEPHWYLALLARHRGRYDAAERHLRAFLSRAGPGLESWRASAERRLEQLEDERRLADPERVGDLRLASLGGSPHFRAEVDRELGGPESAYAARALRYLEEARSEVSRRLGVVPREPLGVVFYGRAAYQRAHAHRFSFRTVGFFDGRIHVSSPAHPSGELRSLLFHEYTHAVFRERTGGDRPYWLNEGLAEHMERRARQQPTSTRSERASLRQRLRAGEWIPLRRLSAGFSGLADEDARAAYLQAILAAEWIEERTTREERARLLARLGQGMSADQALHEVVGVDVDGLDQGVRAALRAEFPPG